MEVSGFLPEDLVQSIEEDDNGNKVGKFSFDGTSTTTGGASRNTVSCKLKNAYGDYLTYEGRYILSFDAKYVTTTPDISSASNGNDTLQRLEVVA